MAELGAAIARRQAHRACGSFQKNPSDFRL